MPTSSFWLFLLWWVGLSALATAVLVLGDRLSRKALPLVALLKLSLVFPDRAPSRLRTALRAGTVQSLQQRIADASAAARAGTPVEAAERLLELVAALDVHDHVTRGHAERVRAYAQMIAEEMRLGRTERDLLNWAALLHDIGKLGIPSEILTKPGRLNEAEYDAIQRHPELGEQLVAPLRSWLGEWSEAVGDHHERWDGRGYPRGKAGEEITLGGRIVAVADVFDVITSARSYKEASTTVEAREELARHAGTQFDERAVRAFLGISLGRLRLAMGPLAWLAHAPVLGRVPLTTAISSLSGALAVVAAAVTTGLVAEGAPGRAQSTPPREALKAAPAQEAPKARPSRPSQGQTRLTPPVRQRPTTAKRPTTAERPTRAKGPATEDPSVEAAPTEPRAHPAAVRVAPHVDAALDEDSTIVIPLDEITGADDVATLRVSAPPHVGEASATVDHALFYRPTRDYHGTTTLGYEACWHDDSCALGRARIVVRSVNDVPRAAVDLAETNEDERVSIDVLANDSDVETESLRVASVSGETHGNATLGNGRVTWSPPTNFNGRATFAYTVEDAQGASDVGRVTVVVAAVNDRPRAVSDAASVIENQSVTIDVLANDSDPEGDRLSLASVAEPSSGSAVRDGDKVRFTAPATSGAASVGYVVRDEHGATDRGSVLVTVSGINSPPSFSAGPSQSVLEDAGAQTVPGWASSISPGPPDEASQTISFLVATTNDGLFGAGGLPAVSPDGTLTYTSASNATGSATVTVRARDDGGVAGGGADTSPPQSFTISVAPVNDPPAAVPDTATVAEDDGAGVTFSVLTNDSDADIGDLLSIASYDASGAGEGVLTHHGRGSFTFVPQADYFGTQSFSYTVTDGNGGFATAVVTIVVTPVPDPPVAADDAYATTPNTPLNRRQPGLRANDGDPDGERVKVETTPVSPPSNGTVSLSQNGAFVYTPNFGFVGTDTFTYRVNDGTGLTDEAVVTITVTELPTTLLYLGTSGFSPEVWDLTTAPPPAASPVPDFEGDGYPGLSIYRGNGSEAESDARKWHTWVRPITAPFVLNGPVALQLWSTIGGFEPHSAGHPHVYLYDCLAGGVACVKLAQSQARVPDWNDGVADWAGSSVSASRRRRAISGSR
jgi:hypothetical protein